MSVVQESWWPVIKDLRQDQEVISERWQAVRRQYNQLNVTCDQLVQSLWSYHALSFVLNKVLSHRSTPYDWIKATQEAKSVQYIDAAQRISYSLQESYSRFLGNLRDHPEVVAEVLKWAGQEGLDTNHLTYDIVSVVYGHCLFRDDHALLLESISHLLMDHVSQCSSVKEMFSIEPVCSRVITEYCHQLPQLKMFLSRSLQTLLMRIIQERSHGYLEYDVTKASTRCQENGDFDVNNYVESSSRFIADICSQFLCELNKFQSFFPPSLKWLLGRLKKYMLQKWPHLTSAELRRPVSYMFFGFIVSSAFVNPDLLGIMDVRIVLNDISWYNVSQVIGVLQGCAWIIDKLESSDYPMKRVVKYMDMIPFNSLIDNIDAGMSDSDEPPPVKSMLPGLRKNSYLFAQNQLDNIISAVYDACNMFMYQADISPIQLEVNKAISVVPDSIIRKSHRNPYSFSLTNLSQVTTPSKDEVPRPQKYNKQRSRSMWGVSSRNGKPLVNIESKSQTLTSRGTLPKSSSSPPNDSRCGSLSPSPSKSDLNSVFPDEVLVLSIWSARGGKSLPVETGWNIQLMSEEEFIRDRFSPGIAAVDPSNSLLSSNIKSKVDIISSSSSSSPILLPSLTVQCVEDSLPSTSMDQSLISATKDQHITRTDSVVCKEDTSLNHSPLLTNNDSTNQLPVTYNHPLTSNSDYSITLEDRPLTSNSDQSLTTDNHQFTNNLPLICNDDSPIIEDQLLINTTQTFTNNNNGDSQLLDQASKREVELSKSWSPETYNGSVTDGEEERREEERSPVSNTLSQSCDDILDERKLDNNDHFSSSAPVKKGGIKAWFGKLKGRKKKKEYTDYAINNIELDLTESPRHRAGSYTRKIGHITAKYEQLSREKRASKPLPSVAPPTLSPTHNWSPRLPVTIEEFIPSKLYQQLKYKLTILLQQIHVPSIEGEREDLKEELLLILSIAQQSVQWRDDYSETGVLFEVIDQLQSLDKACVQELMDGVRENHRVHLKYLDYLSSIQKQCYDAYLQVNSLQNIIERSRQLQVDSFLNFTMSSFCEERTAKLEQVKKDLDSCSSADEKYALVQDCRDAFRNALDKDINWNLWADIEIVYRMCDDHIFSHLYSHIFHPNGESDKERDEVFCKHIERISQSVTPQHHLLKIPQVYYSSCPWTQVQDIFLKMSLYKSPQAKLQCISKACKLLIRLLQLAKCGDPPGADDTFPVLVYILIKSNPRSLLSTEQYIKIFCEDDYLTGETAYWWTQFCSGIGFLRTPEFTHHDDDDN